MSEALWSWMVIVAVAAICVRAVALISPSADLYLLPVRKRHRVEWCTAHARQVELTAAALIAVLAVWQLLFTLAG